MRNCDLIITLDEALAKLPRALGEKLKYSVDLIRKAEKIALRYDPVDGFFNTFSGGKDSQVLYHIVKMSGVKFKTHMSLTSIDPPQVIRFVRSEYPDVDMIKPKMSIFQDAINRKILPTMKIRWCCADFKETTGAGKVTLIGIRAEESARRAKRHEVEISSRKFSGNLEEFEEYQTERIAKKMRTLKRKLNEDEFSLVNENEVRCISGKDSILVSPIFHWTEHDVWTFLNTLGIKHCELYDNGYHRIGCILCPMSSMKQKQREIKDFPHVKRGWINAIKKIRRGGICGRIPMVERPEARTDATQRRASSELGTLNSHYDRKRWLIRGGGGKTSHGDLGGFSVCPSLTADRGGEKHRKKSKKLRKISSIGGFQANRIISGMQGSFYNRN